MEAKLRTVFWHNVVTFAFLLCCLCQLADSKDLQSKCWPIKDTEKGLPFDNYGHFFRLYLQEKTHSQAVQFCKDQSGKIANKTYFPYYRTLRNRFKCSGLKDDQALWINGTSSTGCGSVLFGNPGQMFEKNCDQFYPFICEVPRDTSACLRYMDKGVFLGFGPSYEIFLSKMTHIAARMKCGRLADRSMSKNHLKQYLNYQCSGLALKEKIWFSDSPTCEVSHNTNLDEKWEEDCNNEHIFVCDNAYKEPSYCLNPDPESFQSGGHDYSVHFYKKTYKEAETFCQGCNGKLADGQTINTWLTLLKEQECNGRKLSSEMIWVNGSETRCPATFNGQEVTPGCDTKQIFFCKEGPKSLCWAIRNRMEGIPFHHWGHSFRLYPQRKTYSEAVKFCKDRKGKIADFMDLTREKNLLKQVPIINQTKPQRLWVKNMVNIGIKCPEVLSTHVDEATFVDCDGIYPFICEEARNTSSCLETQPSFRKLKFGNNRRYEIFLSKKTHADATRECKKLADWQTSKHAVEDFLSSACSGPALDEKIWFSDSSTHCVVSFNTNLDVIQMEVCDNKHIFVCDNA